MLQIFLTFVSIIYFNRTARFETRMLFVEGGTMRRMSKSNTDFRWLIVRGMKNASVILPRSSAGYLSKTSIRRTIPFRAETWVPGPPGPTLSRPARLWRFRILRPDQWDRISADENARKASRGERGITNRGEFYSRIFSFFFPRHCCDLEFLEKRKKKDRENYVRRNVRENKFLIFKGKPTLHLFGGIDFDRGYTMDSNTRILLLTCGCLSPLVNTHGCLIGRF